MPDQPATLPIDAEATPALGLPFILNGQAQKHVTHNEALVALDALVQLTVRTVGENAPPADPVEGDRHIVGDAPTGAWADAAGAVAAFTGGAWRIFEPRVGWLAVHESAVLVRTADGWVAPVGGSVDGSPGGAVRAERFGVATDADDTNRLAVASPATLLTHAGSDHRLVVNRASEADTASLMFQTAFSGRAEMGLAGDGGFRIKASADGATWRDALTVDPATGEVAMPSTIRPAAALYPREATRPHGKDERFALAALIDTRDGLDAAGTAWIAPRAGLYLVSTSLVPRSKTDARAGVNVRVDGQLLFNCIFNDTAGTPTTAMNMLALREGAVVTFDCFTDAPTGTASLETATRFLIVRLG